MKAIYHLAFFRVEKEWDCGASSSLDDGALKS
jgi:hypothetical protein